MELNNLSHLGSAANIAARREQHPPIPLTEVLTQNAIYRVPERNLQKQLLVGALACVAWTGVIIVCVMMGVVDLVDLSITHALPPWVAAMLGSFSMSIIALLNRKQLPIHYIFSLLTVSAYIISSGILLALNIKQQWTVALALSVIELILCIISLQNKRNIIMVALVGLQLVLVGLKMDGIITAPWTTVLIIFVITLLTVMLAALVLVGYGFALRCKDTRWTTESVGVLYEGIFLMSLSLAVATVVTRVAYLSTSIYIGGPCLAFHALMIILFMYPFRMEIALYKAGAEIVSIVDRKTTISRVDEETTLYPLSSDWFTLSQKRALEMKSSHPQNSKAQQQRRKECVVCLTQTSNLVWMPCGHLTLCQTCGKYMLDNTKLDCVLCKTKGEQVYHLVGNKNKCLSDYHYQIRTI